MKKHYAFLITLFFVFFTHKIDAQPYYEFPHTSSLGTYSVGGVNVGFNYNLNGGQVYIDSSCASVLGYNFTNGGYFTFGFNVPIAGVRIRGIRQTFINNTNIALKINGASYPLNSSNISNFSACGYNTQGSISNGNLVGGNGRITITQPGINSLEIQNTGGDYWIFVVEILPLFTTTNTPCTGNALNLTSDFGGLSNGVTYNWTGPNGFTSSLKNPSISNASAANSGLYTVTASNGTVTASQTQNAFVNPIPTVNNVNNQTLCTGASVNAINFSSPSITGTICGDVNEGGTLSLSAPTGSIFTSVPFSSYGNAIGSCGNFVLGSCHSSNSVSVVSAAAVGQNSFSLGATNDNFGDPCSGTAKRLKVQLSYTTPVTYSWTNTNTSIGLPASGTGSIASFVATNTTNVPITATITVTPKYANQGTTCSGTPKTFTITVHPSPKITLQPVSTAVCNGGNTTFTAVTSNTSDYQWQVDSGSGFINVPNVAPYSGVTTSILSINGATASLNGSTYRLLASGNCVPSVTSNIVSLTVQTINGSFVVNPVSCNGGSDGSIDFTPSGGTPPYTFSWGGGIVTEDRTGVASGAYTVVVTDSNNCTGTFSTTIAQPNAVVPPTATALAFCEASTVADLIATGTDLKWYDALNNGNLLIDSDTIATGNYYVSQTLNGCESTRTLVSVSVNVTPAPTATTLAFCDASTVADLTASGTNLKWYLTLNGGTALADTDPIATGNYYVSQTLNNCESTRTLVSVSVNITPAPTATTLAFCDASTVADLTATGANLKWYSTLNSGTALVDTTPIATGTYFVSQTLNNCESTRTLVAVSVNITPAPTATALVFCQASTVADLTATGTNLKWYDALNNGNLLIDSDAIATGNYYVSQTLNGCESTRTLVSVSVNVTPAPTATDLAFCEASTVADLTATGTNLKWYATLNGGTALADTAPIATGNYFVSQTLNSCESTRTLVAVSVNVTPAPTAIALAFCQASTVADLTATGVDLKWYDALNNGTLLADSAVIATGNYYVSQTLNGCESTRTLVTVIVNETSLPVGSSSQVFCGSASLSDLVITGTELKWYSVETGGSVLADNTPLSTANYFVSQTLNGCESLRKMVQVVVNSTDAPDGATEQFFTENVTIANLEAEGENIKWYLSEEEAIDGMNALSDTTDLISGATYYATQTINGCESDAVLAVTLTITLGVEEIEKIAFSYYPNPVINELHLVSPSPITNVTVYSLSGQEVINQKWNKQEGILDMSSLADSVYMLKVNFGEREKVVKVIRSLK